MIFNNPKIKTILKIAPDKQKLTLPIVDISTICYNDILTAKSYPPHWLHDVVLRLQAVLPGQLGVVYDHPVSASSGTRRGLWDSGQGSLLVIPYGELPLPSVTILAKWGEVLSSMNRNWGVCRWN